MPSERYYPAIPPLWLLDRSGNIEESKWERPGLQLAAAVTAPLPVSVPEAHLPLSRVRRRAIEVGERRERLTAAIKTCCGVFKTFPSSTSQNHKSNRLFFFFSPRHKNHLCNDVKPSWWELSCSVCQPLGRGGVPESPLLSQKQGWLTIQNILIRCQVRYVFFLNHILKPIEQQQKHIAAVTTQNLHILCYCRFKSGSGIP